MAVNTGVNVSKALAYVVVSKFPGVNVSKALAYAALDSGQPPPPDQRGNIDYNQIRASARTGNGMQFLTYSTPYPAKHGDAGVAGQVAFDTAGNFYLCYAENSWARIGPTGYSNSF